jgi:hypothetical protein
MEIRRIYNNDELLYFKNGFLKRHIRVRLNSFGLSQDIFDGLMKPGEEVWLLIPKSANATVMLYGDNKLIKTEVFDTW